MKYVILVSHEFVSAFKTCSFEREMRQGNCFLGGGREGMKEYRKTWKNGMPPIVRNRITELSLKDRRTHPEVNGCLRLLLLVFSGTYILPEPKQILRRRINNLPKEKYQVQSIRHNILACFHVNGKGCLQKICPSYKNSYGFNSNGHHPIANHHTWPKPTQKYLPGPFLVVFQFRRTMSLRCRL